MTPIISIIMGSTSDLPVMEKAAKFLEEMQSPPPRHTAHLPRWRTLHMVHKHAACVLSLPVLAWLLHCLA